MEHILGVLFMVLGCCSAATIFCILAYSIRMYVLNGDPLDFANNGAHPEKSMVERGECPGFSQRRIRRISSIQNFKVCVIKYIYLLTLIYNAVNYKEYKHINKRKVIIFIGSPTHHLVNGHYTRLRLRYYHVAMY